MRLFDITAAQHYCSSFTASPGSANGSLMSFCDSRLAAGRVFHEGTPQFSELRDCGLRSAERFLFLAASQYRRTVDVMVASAAGWAHVTSYYGSMYCAQALILMFGGHFHRNKLVIEALSDKPGNQELRVYRMARDPKGSHQRFWDLYYAATVPLKQWLTPIDQMAVTPIANDPYWLTQRRNSLNYDAFLALELAAQFQVSFKCNAMRTTLPGDFNTQFRVFEAMLRVTFNFARQFGVATDALDVLQPQGSRRGKIHRTVFIGRGPGLVRQLDRRSVM